MIRKAVIFCGGKATRFNHGKPGPLKPLIKVNNRQIILRIIDIYLNSGVDEIILLGGYKFKELKSFFERRKFNNIKLKVINTGLNTNTAGRLLKSKEIIGKDKFFLTYGDSLTNFNPIDAYKKIKDKKNTFLISIFKKKIPYGVINKNNNYLSDYIEKKNDIFINAGFYIFDEKIFKYINFTSDSLEKKIIKNIIKKKKEKIYTYECDFWHPMDDNSDRINLSKILKNGF